MSSESKNKVSNATLIAAILAFFISGINIYMQYSYRQDDLKRSADKEMLRERKQALLLALEVIDNVYANSNFEGLKNPRKKKWHIAQARDAMNRMIIYCEDPQTTITVFQKAIGLHNPQYENTPKYSAGGIQDFRAQVAKELHLPALKYCDSTKTWIANLPGGE